MFAYSTMSVLVVDDEDIALTFVTQLLRRLGFSEIDIAYNGIGASKLLEEKKYGLIICDWNMPEMSGLELLKYCRADERFRRLPYLMTSIDGSLERIKVARMAGVSAFLLKPFDEHKLRAKLEEVFTRMMMQNLSPTRAAV